MKYGEDCCIGNFINGIWVDSDKDKFAKGILPKLEPFIYEDDGSDGWILLEDFSIRIYDEIITIKKNFDFDGASIPRMFWVTIGHPLGVRKLVAALCHDGFYASHAKKRDNADDLFLELLQAFEESWICRNKCWVAVKSAGWYAYPKTEKELEEYKPFVIITKI